MESVFSHALKFGENEFAWREQEVPAVISFLVQQNKAVIGAEVWILTNEKKIKELYWFDFEIHDKLDTESWRDYVVNTANDFLHSFNLIKGNRTIEEERLVEQGEVYFNITFASEDEYQNLLSSL